jgi:hypothetical protein
MKTVFAIVFIAGLLVGNRARAGDKCAVCGGPIEQVVYFFVDKVAGDKKEVCEKCANLPTECYLCGMPVKENFTELPDGRILCARDVKNVVLDADEAQRIWYDVKAAVERQFSRFITFPENVTVEPLDRVDLQAMFKFAGNDFVCPNVWGCTLRQTNDNHINYKISLLRGLPPAVLKATCAHELTHTWVSENVAPARRRRMNQDAEEGFCELVSYLLMEEQNEETQKGVIRSNAYTRGQFALFLETNKRFGFNDIVDWMKYGVDAQLTGADLGRVRKVEVPTGGDAAPRAATALAARVNLPAAPPPPETLALKGIIWSKSRPLALINDRPFASQEEGKVQLAHTNVTVRCLTIREDSVVIQIVGSDEQQTLRLKQP